MFLTLCSCGYVLTVHDLQVCDSFPSEVMQTPGRLVSYVRFFGGGFRGAYSPFKHFLKGQYTPPHTVIRKNIGARDTGFSYMFVVVSYGFICFVQFFLGFEYSISDHRDFLLPGEGVYNPLKGNTLKNYYYVIISSYLFCKYQTLLKG